MFIMTITVEIEYVAKLLYNAYGIPVLLEDTMRGIVANYGFYTHKNPVYATEEAFITHVIHKDDALHRPLLKVTDFLEYFLLLHIGEEGLRTGTLIIGPTLATDVADEMISGLIQDHRVPSHLYEPMRAHYKKLVRVNLAEWHSIGQLAHFLLFRQMIDVITLAEYSNPSRNLENTVDEELLNRRLAEEFHMSHRNEQLIWQCIKEGDSDKLAELLSRINLDGAGLLSKKSQIRHIKNQAIVSISLSTRAAVEGGLYPEIAYTMSDTYIQDIEDEGDTHRIYSYLSKFLHDLTYRVHANKQNAQTKAISVCKNYIFNHIFEQISVHVLAQLVELHPVYLSQMFKKESGFPLGQYIQREKIREAQKLLVQSDLAISEISMLLQFNDQSYFTNVFKKFTGVTPNKYRKNPQDSLLLH